MEVLKDKKRKVAEEYLSSLADLNLNSKPLINMLTILAEENIEHAEVIVSVVQQHIEKVNPEVKLPILYLIDSIVKNVKHEYIKLFSNCIVNIFCGAFEKVNEKIREKMYTLRQTWNDVFPLVKLYALDVKVNFLDPNWPITAKVVPKTTAIHVNPNFLVEKKDSIPKDIHIKQRKLLELQKQKLELELEATKKQLQQAEGSRNITGMATVTSQIHGMSQPNIPNQGHVNRLAFNQFRPNTAAIKNPAMNNAFGNFTQQNNRIKIAPVNPVMMHSLSKRDPRLARQQNNLIQSDINNQNKTANNIQIKHPQEQQDNLRSSDNFNQEREVQKSEKTRSKGNSTKRSSKRDYPSNSKSLDGSTSNEIKSSSSKISRSNSSTRSPNTYSSPKHSTEKSKKSSPSERKRSSSKDNSAKREEKSKSSPSSKNGSPNHKGSVSPNSPRFKEFRSLEHKSRNYIRRNKEISKSPSPVKEVDEKMESPDKRFKFTIPKKETAIEKLDQNADVKPNDTDLRMSLQNNDKPENNASNNNGESIKMSPTRMLIEKAEEIRAIGKKRPSTDQQSNAEELEQPIAKKPKNEKIDHLFGSEDVDLRVPPSLISVSTPPPPIISSENENESENWAKVKGSTKDEKLSPMRSTLEDVRAKLAKAAKNSNYKFIKNRKVTAINKQNLNLEINEDSRDANDDNLRVIINQAQELYDSENINVEQYNSLVTTVMQINENNKLKEAKRRESMLDKSNNDEKPKEQRKRIPKLAKSDQTNDKIEQTSILPQPKSVSTAIVGRAEAGNAENETNDIRRKRIKESKWSAATPWENKQASSVQQPWSSPNNRSNMPLNAPSQFGSKMNQPQHSSPWQNPPSIFSNNSMQPLQFNVPVVAQAVSMPKPADIRPHFSNSVNNPQADLVRTIPIDGIAKEIRIYDDVAIVFMDWDEPREIGFQDGQRRVCIDNEEPIALNFNDDFKTIQIQGNPHKIRYGFPSRELYIDKNWYECYFGGPPLTIPLNGKMHIVKIEGPPPQVNIGPLRPDLVVGRINFIVDAHVIIPVFLDCRLQTFELKSVKHTLQFADALSIVIFNNEPHTFEYGGLPKPVKLGGKKYFIRFAALPNGVVPGKINIKNMICTKPRDKFVVEETKFIDVPSTKLDNDIKITSITDNIMNKNELIAPIKSTQNTTIAPVDVSSVSTAPTAPLLPNINIDELFQKLLATGILNNKVKDSTVPPAENVANTPIKDESEPKKEISVKPIDLSISETIKTRQVGMVNKLFCGMQCSSCGLRFPPEQTMKYSQHLDWHFRQNRREKDSTRKAHNRKWYYDLADWIQYEEIEDFEDREKNWFESQQQLDVDMDENSNHRSNSPIPSCPAGPEDVDRACDVCNEKFEHFYNEELEEWHLKSAVRYDDHIYHPICYQDLKASTEKEKEKEEKEKEEKEKEEKEEETKEENEEDKTEIIDDDSVIIVKQEKLENDNHNSENNNMNEDDDDDDVIVLPNEEPSVTEIIDDDDPMIDENLEENDSSPNDDAEIETKTENNELRDVPLEDDIVIEEPNIPFTDLDTYVEKDLSELNNDDTTQSSFHNIKIKEEPRDEEENENADYEDAFEDVGTIAAPIDLLQDSSDQIIETTSIDDENSVLEVQPDINSSANISMDGNVKNIDAPTTMIGVNKIKINIAKNISNNNSNNNKIVNESNNKNISSNNTGNSISTIPVITSSTSNFASNATNLNMNSNLISLTNNISDNSNKDLVGSSNSSLLLDNDNEDLCNTTINKKSEIPKIEYDLKPELKDVNFNIVPPIESGYDTSGLCSIM